VIRLGLPAFVKFSAVCFKRKFMWSEDFERRAAEMRYRNDRERLASRIGHDHLRIAETVRVDVAMERHYTVQELGALWRVSRDTIIRIFREEPGVLKIGPGQARRGRRRYVTLRIPESVVLRVHRRLSVR